MMRTIATIPLIILLASFPLRAQEAASAPMGWTLSGTVKTERGPVGEVYLRASGPANLSARADKQGRFTFSGTIPGTYTIRVRKPDDASEPRSRSRHLAPGDKVSGFDLFIPRGASIKGRVTDAAGRSVSSLVVIAYARSTERGQAQLIEKGGAITDDRGVFRISHLPEGGYLVAAVPSIRKRLKLAPRSAEPGRQPPAAFPPWSFAPGDPNSSAAREVQVAGEGEIEGIDIRLDRVPGYCAFFKPTLLMPLDSADSYSLSVRQWNEIPGPGVGGGVIKPGVEYELCGLPEGSYRATISVFSELNKPPLRGLGHGRIAFEVAKRHTDAGAILIQPMSKLEGILQVRDTPPGEPVPEGIRVGLNLPNLDWFPGENLIATVRRDGTFEFATVRDDMFIVRLENLPPRHYVIKQSQAGEDARTGEVKASGGKVSIELARDGPIVSGRVLTPGSNPTVVVDADVFLFPSAGGAARIVPTDQNGSFSFMSGIEPGEYRIVALANLPETIRRESGAVTKFMDRAATLKLERNGRVSQDLVIANPD